MKLTCFKKSVYLFLLFSLVVSPVWGVGWSDEFETVLINETAVPTVLLQSLKDAQADIQGLRANSFSRIARGQKEWPPEVRDYLATLILKYESARWRIKRELNQTFPEGYSHLQRVCPTFDEHGNPIGEAPLKFNYRSTIKGEMKSQVMSSTDLYRASIKSSVHIDELAYGTIMRFVKALIKYIVCPSYTSADVQLSRSLAGRDPEDLVSQIRRNSRSYYDQGVVLLESFGFMFRYNGTHIDSLTSLDIIDQDKVGFRAVMYAPLPNITGETQTHYLQWLDIRRVRAEVISRGLRKKLAQTFEQLKEKGYLVTHDEVVVSSPLASPLNPYNCTSLPELMKRTIAKKVKTLPFPAEAISYVKVAFHRIWSSERSKATDLLAYFFEVLERMFKLSLSTGSNSIYKITDKEVVEDVGPSKFVDVEFMGKKYTVRDFEIQVKNSDGQPTDWDVNSFMGYWKTLSFVRQKQHLSLLLLEYLFASIDEISLREHMASIKSLYQQIKKEGEKTNLLYMKETWENLSEALFETHKAQQLKLVEVFCPTLDFAPSLKALLTSNSLCQRIACLVSYRFKSDVRFEEINSAKSLLVLLGNAFCTLSDWEERLLPILPEPSVDRMKNKKKGKGKAKSGKKTSGTVKQNGVSTERNKDKEAVDSPPPSIPQAPTPPKSLSFAQSKNVKSNLTSALQEAHADKEAYKKTKKAALNAYMSPPQEKGRKDEYHALLWAALTYYNAHLPESWAEIAELEDEGCREEEFIQNNFDVFFAWYTKHEGVFERGKTASVAKRYFLGTLKSHK